ncbi:MAG TPA: hypothetical protein QGI30_00120 [Anaerolineales bacterium]|jgi:hypothetical protein|nr:hypothetical protein [Anaerolineales bacterium]|tara:strand:- start:2125 stop:2439 length:315 start_codon:yes stop_codon:yes gene_type:complete
MTWLAAIETLTATSTAATIGAVAGEVARLAAIETLTAALTAATIGAVAGDVARLAAVETLTAATSTTATTAATTAASVWPRHRVGQIGDVQILAYVFNFTVTLT